MPSKLSFKGEKPKKKKRSHKEAEDGADDLALMAAGDPRGMSFILETWESGIQVNQLTIPLLR